MAYLPIDPKDIGRDYQAVIRVNSQSGKGGVAFVLERDYGLNLPRWMQVELAQQVQKLSEQRSGEIDSATIYALFLQHFVTDHAPFSLDGYKLERADGQDLIQAKIFENGNQSTLHGNGEGALSAFIDGWIKRSKQQISVVDYNEHAIGAGTDAEAVAYVQLNIDGQRVSGVAFDHDTLSASLKAVLSALNRNLACA